MHSGGGSSSDPARSAPANNVQPASDSNPSLSNDVTPPAKKSAPARKQVAGSNANLITGCWLVNGNIAYTIHADGSISAGPFTGHWRDLGNGHYTFTWPDMIETLAVSPDQRSMSGGNEYGFPITGGRTSAGVGLAGSSGTGPTDGT